MRKDLLLVIDSRRMVLNVEAPTAEAKFGGVELHRHDERARRRRGKLRMPRNTQMRLACWIKMVRSGQSSSMDFLLDGDLKERLMSPDVNL